MLTEARQPQLKNACSVRMSVAFTFLAHTYYAAILNYGTMCAIFPLPRPGCCTFAFSSTTCLYSPAQRDSFTCWWCHFSWAFPSSSRRNYALKSQVQVVKPTISLNFRNRFPYLLHANMQISVIFRRRVAIGRRHFEDWREIVSTENILKINVKKPFRTGTLLI